ncbi:ChrR family anti-sigma-E factor [Marinivivus vitaminiproducens]|uniref:ChrR family anti-sigma-E factor n=1 Tax=Marinivivus vitaminiproducens TaxID=3035935 RepID=UPI00279CEDB2|nr:ChrR family anti-sigma-E factor [Geminicoccaceae bacterium SCSIO 64248]
MTPAHHLPEELMLAYAAGLLGRAGSVFVESHLALCPVCRVRLALLEDLGGSLIEREAGSVLSRVTVESVLAASERDGAPAPPHARAGHRCPIMDVPRPLARVLPEAMAAEAWQVDVDGLLYYTLDVSDEQCSVRLLRATKAVVEPLHVHEGIETVLVLHGGFAAEGDRYDRGDVAVWDESVQHSPAFDAGTLCLCMITIPGAIRVAADGPRPHD